MPRSVVRPRVGRLQRWAWVIPAAFVVMTFAFTWPMSRPLADGGGLRGVGSWLLATAVLTIPFLAALLIMVIWRSSLLMLITALAYVVVAGLLGLAMDVAVITSDGSTAAVGLAVMLAIQIFVLVPLAAVGAVIARLARSGRMPRIRTSAR